MPHLAHQKARVRLVQYSNSKERRYPELSGQFVRSRLVVVGGRWSEEACDFLQQLAKAKVRGEPFSLQRRAEAAWLLRWRVSAAKDAPEQA